MQPDDFRQPLAAIKLQGDRFACETALAGCVSSMFTSSSECTGWQEDTCVSRRFFSCFLNNALIRPARYSLGVLHLEFDQHGAHLGCCIWKEFPVASCHAIGMTVAVGSSDEYWISRKKWLVRQQRGSFWPMAALESPHVAGGLQLFLFFSPALNRFQPVFNFTSLWVDTSPLIS